MDSANNKGISALLIDDHKLIVLGLKAILTCSDFDFKDIESATTGNDALKLAGERNFDIYIIDIELPDINGFDLIEEIRKIHPKARIIVNTIHEDLAFFRKVEKYEVNAVVCKSLDTEVVMKAIKAVLNNRTYYCKKPADRTQIQTEASTSREAILSKSEIKVLELIAQGLSTADIAAHLFVSTNTVETHRRHINEKLGTKNVAGMIVKGVKLGLLNFK